MFKKAFQIIVTFGVLVGAYQAYLLGFAALTTRIGDRPAGERIFVHQESKSALEASRFAGESFGAGHWAADRKLKIRYYDAIRGFYMYAGDYKRLDNGKRFEFWPFAVIWMGKDGRSRKTAVSARAIVELNEGLTLVKPGSEPMHVVEATLENDVMLRDDKGTLAVADDDLTVGPLPYITYTEKTDPPQIVSESDIRLADRDFVMTGHHLLIELRKRDGGGPAGFDARTAYLKRRVHITARDAGKGGVLPGVAKGTKVGGATPVDLKSDGEMRIDFPAKPSKLRPKVAGPPEPEGPTIAMFHRNVVVVRGTVLPDALNCDTLRLTFMPVPRAPAPPQVAASTAVTGAGVFEPGSNGVTSPIAATGPLTELSLSEANARGFAVWLRSTAQGTTAKCNELIYKKLAPFAPDESYLRADVGKQIKVDKVDTAGPVPGEGAITSVTTVWAADAKIFDDGKGGVASTVVARGPGRLEARPGQDKPAEQTASWDDELIMRTTAVAASTKGAAPSGDPASTRRQITLTGNPKLADHTKTMSLEAKNSIVVSLKPRPEDAAKPKAARVAKAGESASPLGSGSFQIEWLQAREDVRLSAPGKTMIARDSLDAPFEEIAAADPTPGPAPAPALALTTPEPTPKPAEVAKADDKAATKGKADAPAPKADPAVTVTAHRVWTKIRQGVGGVKSEIAEARLRGAVKFHQDPATDKARGIDVAGEALDLKSVGNGRMNFKVFDTDPEAMKPGGTRIASSKEGGLLSPVATIDTEDYAIRGPVIGLDQSNDFAWVIGPGSFTQLADRGLLSEKGLRADGEEPAPAGKPKPGEKAAERKVPMVISWTDEMRFYGRATDPEGRPAGKAEFRGGVDARMEDGRIVADAIDTYTDRPVPLVAPARTPAAAGKPAVKSASGDTSLIDRMFTVSSINPEDTPARGDDDPKGRPELAYVDARNVRKREPGEQGVVIVSVKRDPATRAEIEVQRIEAERVVYDKRSGDYAVPGAGQVYLWRRGAKGSDRPGLPGGPLDTARRPEARQIADGPKTKGDGPRAKEYGGWELTKIKFVDEMRGRFGIGKDRDLTEPRTADFYGRVQAINAPVSGPNRDLNFDGRPKDFKFMTADALRVVDFPPPPDVKDAPAKHWLTAEGNARARTNTHALDADQLTYDSAKDLFYAYGEEGREVVITDQAHPGQPGSIVRGQAAKYNHETGASELMNPSTINFRDGNTGVRPQAEAAPNPAGPAGKPRPKRPGLRPPPAQHIERKGFSGR